MKQRRIITALQVSRNRKNRPLATPSRVAQVGFTADDYLALICLFLVIAISSLIILADCLAPESTAQKELTPVPVFIKSRHR